MKITKALILAAGVGTRIRPMSNKIPKPLIKIKGKPMIETLIEAMLHHGINDITVVVGYMKEKFYYLKDKYKEVSLIENKEYESRGAISSFYAAKHLLNDNYLITEGNFFINDFSILDPNVENTTYLYQKTTPHNNIWGFVFKKGSNEIIKLIRDFDNIYIDNKLYGIAFWKKEDLLKLVKEVEDKYNLEENINIYHDDLLNNIIDKMKIEGRQVDKKVIKEVNELEDLLKVDKRYLEILKREEENKFQKVIELAEVLSLNSDQLVGVHAAPGRSLNNKNYVIETEDQKYFLRIAGEGTELFNDRSVEKQAYEQLNGHNIVDKVYFLDEDSGMKISEFYENSRILNFNDNVQLTKFVNKLKELHKGDFKFIKKDNIFDRMLRYERFVKDANGAHNFGKDMPRIIKEMYEYKKIFNNEKEYVPIHGDCSPNNTMVLENGEILLIDLEFVSMGDPFSDLANFAHDAQMNPRQLQKLLRLYLDRKPERKELYKIYIYAAAISIMWYSWAVYKMVSEPQDLYKYKKYRDSYYDWYEIMYEAAKRYE